MPTYRAQKCRECGKEVVKRVRHDRKVYCSLCASKRIMANAFEMAYKQGTGYEKWREAMRKAADEA